MRVLISAPYFIPVIPRFAAYFERAGLEVVIADVVERLSEDDLLQHAGTIDGVISGDDRFSEAVLEAYSPRLKVISKWGTGIDSIEQVAARNYGIQVLNTPDAFTDAVADSVMAYILAFARQLPWMDERMKSGGWVKIRSRALHECTLGVIGVGRIGKTVLQRAHAFGMTLFGNDIVEIEPDILKTYAVEMMPLTDLLNRADFISLNCDLNPSSRHLINRSALGQVKEGAIIINTARGPVIDEDELVKALQSGRLAGAGLDVFEDEPLPRESPLRTMENVLLGSHNANSSPSAWERVHRQTMANLFLGLGLETPAF